jgi:sporulation integral membrane protein YtvI
VTTEQMRNSLIRIAYWAVIVLAAYGTIKYLLPFFMPFILGFLVALLLRRPAERLTRRFGGHRNAVCVFLLIVFYALLVLLFVFLGGKIADGIAALIAGLPDFYTETIEPALDASRKMLESFGLQLNGAVGGSGDGGLLQSLGSQISGASRSILTGVTDLAGSMPSLFIRFILTIVSSFFLTIDYPRITAWLDRVLPEKTGRMLHRIFHTGLSVTGGFLRAYSILFCITAAELAIGLSLMHVKGSVPLALLIGIVDILPILGVGTVLIPWSIIMFILGNSAMGAGLLVLYVIITAVRQSLEPHVVGNQIGLYPLVTLLCMFVGLELFGFWGLFLLPVGATIAMHIYRENASADKTAEVAA